ncbi:MAG: hypothetical protein HIU92_18940, partial [Proteobacteria bacterium]|nr:hypothetical protein [Pseudomonadota bacterium]
MAHTRASLALLGLATALGGVIALEALSGSPQSRDAARAIAAPPIHVITATHTPPPPLDAWASVILNRPVFAPDRRPPAV